MRIKVILQNGTKRRINNIEVAKALELSPQNLSNYIDRGKIPYETLTVFCAIKKVSINWMLFDQITSSLEDPTMKYVGVKYIPDANASCGGGASYATLEQNEIVKFPWYMLEELKQKSNIENIHIINVIGDSMEPKLYENDRVFIDTSKTEITRNNMFVISTPSGIFIKELSIEDGVITLISLNELYYDEVIDYDIKIIGMVVGKF